MTGKGAESAKELLSGYVVKAVKSVMEEHDGSIDIEAENIKVEKKVGGGIENTEFVEGVILDKERVHPSMPKKVANAKIALVDSAIEIKSTEADAKIQINDPEKMQSFLLMEENMIKDMADKIKKSGANVLFCQKGIDELAQHYLAKEGIYCSRRIKKSDMESISRATGARVTNSLDDLTKEDLGKAGVVEEKKVGDEPMTYVRSCKNPKSVTILVRGGTEHVIDEAKRAIVDAIGDVVSALKEGKVLAGAGAPEMELERNLKLYSNSLSGREQLAVNAFAEAMEVIPKTLAENAGLDPIDVITDLKAAHDKGKKWAGINVFTGKVMDAWKEGVIEPLKIKTQAVSSSSEVAIMILRIDDVIAAGDSGQGEPMPPGGMPPGMGGGMPY